MDNREILARYERWLIARNRARTTVEQYRRITRSFSDHLDGRSLNDATRDDVESFLARRRIGPGGRANYISNLAGLYAWMLDEELATVDPTAKIPRPTLPHGMPRPIATEDLALAMQTASPKVRAFLTLGCFQGMRAREVAHLASRDLLLHLTPPALLVTHGKGARERVLPLHALTYDALLEHGLPRSGFVFPGRFRDHLAPYSVSQIVSEHFRDLGITATFHQLRHWNASALYQQTHDLRLVQNLLGHQSPQTTALYAAFDQRGASLAVNTLSLEVQETPE